MSKTAGFQWDFRGYLGCGTLLYNKKEIASVMLCAQTRKYFGQMLRGQTPRVASPETAQRAVNRYFGFPAEFGKRERK
jgi:hypothetical protein